MREVLLKWVVQWFTETQKRKKKEKELSEKEQKEFFEKITKVGKEAAKYNEELYRFPILFFDGEFTEKFKEVTMKFTKELIPFFEEMPRVIEKYKKSKYFCEEVYFARLQYQEIPKFSREMLKFIQCIEDEARKIMQAEPNPSFKVQKILEHSEYLSKVVSREMLKYSEHSFIDIEKPLQAMRETREILQAKPKLSFKEKKILNHCECFIEKVEKIVRMEPSDPSRDEKMVEFIKNIMKEPQQ